jgi:hypothetical protein
LTEIKPGSVRCREGSAMANLLARKPSFFGLYQKVVIRR